MNAPSLLTPALLDAVAVFIAGLTVFLVAVHSGMFALAAQRARLSARAQTLAPLLAAAFLAAWAGWAIVAVKNPVIVPEAMPLGNRPVVLLKMFVMLAAGGALIFGSKTVRAINAATPPAWLIAVQVYRVAGAMFLWPLLASGALPAGFALPAGIGDALTGIAAPFVALAVVRGHPRAWTWAVAWNWFGVLDLVVATTAAALTQSTNIGRFPLVIVPLFLGPPLGILTHLYSLRNLAATRDTARAAAMPGGVRAANA
jgi:hypothetical protein